ncbi:MAG: biotin transporter BioY [Candidatus Competibacterales bacterium]
MTAASPLYPTLSQVLLPAGFLQSHCQWLLPLAASGLLTLAAKLQIPFWPVPMTLQTFAVLVIAMGLGSRLGMAAVVLYLAQGAAGLPVFAGGGGLGYLTGPTGGYLVGFVAAAGLMGWLAERGFDRSTPCTLLAMTLGTALIFVPGLVWLSAFVGWHRVLEVGLWPFLPAEGAKILLAAALLPGLWHWLGRRS